MKRIRPLLAASVLAAVAATGASPGTAAANVCADYNGGYFARWQGPVNTMLINELTYEAQFDKTKVRARILDGADTWTARSTTAASPCRPSTRSPSGRAPSPASTSAPTATASTA